MFRYMITGIVFVVVGNFVTVVVYNFRCSILKPCFEYQFRINSAKLIGDFSGTMVTTATAAIAREMSSIRRTTLS